MAQNKRTDHSNWYRTFGTIGVILVLSSGCGIAMVNEFEQLTADELAQKSDEFVCGAGARIQMISVLPPIWIRELKKRDLWECVSEYRRGGGSTRVIIEQDKAQ